MNFWWGVYWILETSLLSKHQSTLCIPQSNWLRIWWNNLGLITFLPHIGTTIPHSAMLSSPTAGSSTAPSLNLPTPLACQGLLLHVCTLGKNAVWNRIVRYHAVKWKLMVNSNVLKRGSHPILTVTYEDLKKDSTAEVKRMLDFLQFPYSIMDLEKKLHEGFTQFYRNHTDTFEHFTNEQKEFVNGIILETVQKLQHSKNVALGSKLQEYVMRWLYNKPSNEANAAGCWQGGALQETRARQSGALRERARWSDQNWSLVWLSNQSILHCPDTGCTVIAQSLVHFRIPLQCITICYVTTMLNDEVGVANPEGSLLCVHSLAKPETVRVEFSWLPTLARKIITKSPEKWVSFVCLSAFVVCLCMWAIYRPVIRTYRCYIPLVRVVFELFLWPSCQKDCSGLFRRIYEATSARLTAVC